MKKFLCLLTVICLTLSLLAGCGGKEPVANDDGNSATITVDDFLGKTEEEIKANKEYTEKYNFEFVYEHNSDYPEGEVCVQLPAAGEIFSEKPYVTLTVSRGAKEETIPNLIGKKYDIAREALEALGFDVTVQMTSHETAQKGTVYATDPKAGTKTLTNQPITIYVSEGRETFDTVILPDLVGMSLTDAERIIYESGLVVGNVYELASDKTPAGCVVSYTPSGKEFVFGESIDIVISTGLEE